MDDQANLESGDPLSDFQPFERYQDPSSKITLPLGSVIDLLDPHPCREDVDDVVEAMGRVNVFGSSSPHFYSAAQFAVFATLLFRQPPMALAAALWQSANVLLGTTAAPVLKFVAGGSQEEIERVHDRLQAAILEAYGLKLPLRQRHTVAVRDACLYHALYFRMVLRNDGRRVRDDLQLEVYRQASMRIDCLSREILFGGSKFAVGHRTGLYVEQVKGLFAGEVWQPHVAVGTLVNLLKHLRDLPEDPTQPEELGSLPLTQPAV